MDAHVCDKNHNPTISDDLCALAYGREDWYTRPAGTTGLLSRLLARWLRLEGAPWPLFLTSFVAIGGCHYRTNGHAEGRASRRRSGRRAQAADYSMLSHCRVVAIASDSAFSLPALLGRGSLARSHAPSNSKVFELCTRF